MQQTSPGRAGPIGRGVAPRSMAAPSAEASAAPAELRAVIDAMPDAVLVCDRGGRVRLVNPAADRLFAGRPVIDHRDLMSRFESLTDPAAGAADQPILVRPLDRPQRWFELRSLPIERSDTRLEEAGTARGGGRIFVLRDVTQAKEERAERRAFLSILSHELRTPITTIYAGSRVLARREATTPRASQEIAADISAEAARLYDVV